MAEESPSDDAAAIECFSKPALTPSMKSAMVRRLRD
jgi:hypothetical protein